VFQQPYNKEELDKLIQQGLQETGTTGVQSQEWIPQERITELDALITQGLEELKPQEEVKPVGVPQLSEQEIAEKGQQLREQLGKHGGREGFILPEFQEVPEEIVPKKKGLGKAALETAVGIPEAGGALFTGIPLYIAGVLGQTGKTLHDIWKTGGRGIGGIGDLLRAFGEAEPIKEEWSKLAYQPQTEAGAELSRVAIAPVELYFKGVDELAKITTDDPTTQKGIRYLADLALLFAVPKAKTYIKDVMTRKAPIDVGKLRDMMVEAKEVPREVKENIFDVLEEKEKPPERVPEPTIPETEIRKPAITVDETTGDVVAETPEVTVTVKRKAEAPGAKVMRARKKIERIEEVAPGIMEYKKPKGALKIKTEEDLRAEYGRKPVPPEKPEPEIIKEYPPEYIERQNKIIGLIDEQYEPAFKEMKIPQREWGKWYEDLRDKFDPEKVSDKYDIMTSKGMKDAIKSYISKSRIPRVEAGIEPEIGVARERQIPIEKKGAKEVEKEFATEEGAFKRERTREQKIKIASAVKLSDYLESQITDKRKAQAYRDWRERVAKKQVLAEPR